MGHKRRREDVTEVSKRTEVYEDLAHLDAPVRLKAAQTLLTEVVPGADTDQLKEILRRLFRGLCSGRKAARLGFSVALTELLGTTQLRDSFPDVSVVVDVLLKQTQAEDGLDGQESRDHHIGRLFGAEAVLKSGLLFQPKVNDGESEKILDLIFDLAKKKPWLREQCGFVLHRMFEDQPHMLDEDFSFAQSTINRLQSYGLAKTPEGVAIWIVISKSFGDVKLPHGVWRQDSPLCREDKSKLALVLKEASATELDSEGPNTQRGSWVPKLHFAWLVVMNRIMRYDAKAEKPGAPVDHLSFPEFWQVCVEDALFGNTSSDERKYWGLSLFHQGLTLANTPEHHIALFSPKLTQCLANHLASNERYLHRAAEKARNEIVTRAWLAQVSKIWMIEALLTNGHVMFDKISKTRTIEDILIEVDEATSEQICEVYMETILDPGIEDQKPASQARQAASDQLFSMVKSTQKGSEGLRRRGQNPDRVIQRILSVFAAFAYFDLGVDAVPEISTATRTYFRTRLSSCLTYLTANTKDSATFAAYVTTVISKRETIPEDAKLLLEAESDVQKVLDQALKVIRRLTKDVDKEEGLNQSSAKSGLLLVSVVFLQVHDGDLDAIGMLEELNEAFSKKHMTDQAQKDGHSATILIEILMALAAKPSKLFRRLSHQVFESIAVDVDENMLQSMLKVLKVKENSEGQDELFDKIGEEDNEGMEEDDDSEASDVEVLDGKSSSEDDQTSEDDSDAVSPSADEEEGSEPDEDLAAFDAKLAQALGTRPANENLDADDDGVSDEDMNDEEMEALDEHLANVFREQKKATSKKLENKHAKKNIVDFKCRVLELLEIFVKRQHRKYLALKLVLPALVLIRTTSHPQVSQKVLDLFREYTRLSKGKNQPPVVDQDGDKDPGSVISMLQGVHKEAMMPGSNIHANACSQASLILVRILADYDEMDNVVQTYGQTYIASYEKALFEKNFKVKMSLFTDFNNWVASYRL